MTAERGQEIAELFAELVELAPEAWQAALERSCAGDPELRRELERLLAADAVADELLAPYSPLLTREDAPDPARDPLGLIGRAVGRYVVEAFLGEGGMGVVYRARDARLDRAVALKFLAPGSGRDAAARERLLREARAASGLDHPNICTIYEVGETPDARLYIAMALYSGETLRQRIARGPLAIADALDLAAQVARGLAHAHAQRIMHRDIKPENLLITHEGVVKILDFGLARSELATLTRPGLRAGTASYMAPEQAGGEPVDHRTDLWSLGVVLHEMLTAERPFMADDPLAVMLAVRTVDPAPPSASRPDVPAALDALVRRLLSRDPARRPAGAREVEAELTAIRAMTEQAVPSRRGGLWPAPFLAGAGRRRVLALAASATALGVLAVFALGFGAHRAGILPERSLVARGVVEARDRVLIADFGSPSGDSLLAAAVTEAIRVDLDRSPAVQVVDRGYVAEVFGRMARDPGTPLRGAVAREVALREGIKARVEGEITAAGTGFVLVARLVSANEGPPLVALRETARDSMDLIPAVDRLSRTLRRRIGEPLRTVQASEPLERITTPSLEALLLYARGSHAYHVRGDFTTARDLLLEAVRVDTAFAMAYRKLGIVVYTDQETRVRSLERAYAFRDRLPAVERFFITGTYHTQLTFEPGPAFRAYRQLLEIDPTNWMAAHNLAIIHSGAGELERAEELLRGLPDDGANKFINLHNVLLRQGRAAEADSVIERATTLFQEHMFAAGYRLMFLIMEDRVSEADSLARLWDARPLPTGSRALYLAGVGLTEALRGRYARADSMLAAAPPLALRVAGEQVWEYAITARARAATRIRGDPAAAAGILDATLAERPLESLAAFDRPYIELAIAYAEAGRHETAAALLEAYEREIPPGLRGSPEMRLLAGGYLALARGQPAAALDTLRRLDRLPMRYCGVCGGFPRGLAWDRLGQPDSAAAAYREFVDYPARSYLPENLALPDALLRLADLLEARGDTALAAHYYDRFLRLWADADPVFHPRIEAARRAAEALHGAGR